MAGTILLAKKSQGDARLELVNVLDTMARQYMQAHCKAYGDTFIKPKTHQIFDLVGQIRRDQGRVFDCFMTNTTQERRTLALACRGR